MVTSEHASRIAAPERPAVASGRRRASGEGPSAEARDTGDAQVRQLLDRAAALRLRAPELARVLGERAAALAESAGANTLWVHAESLVVLTTIRIGDRSEMTARAVAVLRAAEDAEEHVLAVRLRTALAVSARQVGSPMIGLALLRPAVSTTGVPGVHRAAALCQLARCAGGVTGKAELDKMFATADRLCSEDSTLDNDTRLVRRALLRVGMSTHRRRYGDIIGAADAARTGMGFLDGLDDAGADGGVARARLSLELVVALLDRGETTVALEVAGPILLRPPRSAEVAAVAWLRLAVATRVHLAAGEGHAATRLLRDALHDTDRHGMPELSAQLRAELSHVEERMGRPADALETLRDARADERSHDRSRGRAHAVLTSEFGAGDSTELDFAEILREQPVADSAGHVAEPASAEVTATLQRITDRADTAGGPQAAAAEGSAVVNEEPRHTAQQGAGSVLDRLGIAGGGAERHGGRRRAAEEVPEHDGGGSADPTPPVSTPSTSARSTSTPPTSAPVASSSAMDAAAVDRSAGHDADEGRRSTPASDAMDGPISRLPRLRLPPSLAPVEEWYSQDGPSDASQRGAGDSSDHERGTSSQHGVSPVPDHASDTAGDSHAPEPSADAGLAELLTRALAEHQAGGSSAATLVERLGTGSHDTDDASNNGRHRNGG